MLGHVVAVFLDAWTVVCATVAPRRGARAAEAMASAAVGDALLALGYPAAMTSPRTLGTTLARLRGRGDRAGRRLGRWKMEGGYIWYVTPPGTVIPQGGGMSGRDMRDE